MSTFTNVRALIYLWSRDAEMPVSEATIDYIVSHLSKVNVKDVHFSDTARIKMVDKILELI